MWSYKVEDKGDKADSESTQEESSSLNMLSQAMQLTLGADSELFQMAAGTYREDGQGTGTISNDLEFSIVLSDESSVTDQVEKNIYTSWKPITSRLLINLFTSVLTFYK